MLIAHTNISQSKLNYYFIILLIEKKNILSKVLTYYSDFGGLMIYFRVTREIKKVSKRKESLENERDLFIELD